MDETPLYQQISESLRQEILRGVWTPGARLPSVRELAQTWHCTPGTIQRAYAELVEQHLLETRRGQGTRVIATPSVTETPTERRVTLLHRVEEFLLESTRQGYTLPEIESSLRLGLERWQAFAAPASQPAPANLRFAGSHDPALVLLLERFATCQPEATFPVRFVGSLGGLIQLAQGEAELAGCHLWDAAENVYNEPFVRRLLPGRKIALVTLAHRRLGLIVAPGNPHGLQQLADIIRSGARFVQRQRGTGTRIWVEAQLHSHGLSAKSLARHPEEALTHSAVARFIAEEQADVGVGLEAAARTFDLDFVPLTTEPYDLVIPYTVWEHPAVQALLTWLSGAEGHALIHTLPGYDTHATGNVYWVE